MLRILLEQGLSYKVGAMTAGSNILFGTWTSLAWVGANLAQIGLGLSALLTITLIISHVCKTIRDNKASREASSQQEVTLRKSEIEMEELRLKVELLKLELKEKEENNK